jgi:hypothetical protein
MQFSEQDLVKITTFSPQNLQSPNPNPNPHPSSNLNPHTYPHQDLVGRVGFVDYIKVSRPRGPGRKPWGPGSAYQYQVGLLTEEGLDEIITVSEYYLAADDSEEAKQFYANYQATLEGIQREADDRQHQYFAVAKHLADKYNITPNEVHGIYKAILNYQDYYKDML